MAYQEFYCNAATGSNLNSGSTPGAPIVTYTSGSWNSTTRVFTVASGDPVADGVTVGQYVSVFPDGSSPPTGFIGRVTAVTSTTITVSSTDAVGTNPSTGTSNRTLICGGAWQGPNGAQAFPFGFITHTARSTSNDPPRVNFRNNATYNITAGINFGGSNARDTTFQGYSTTPGDGGRAIIDGGTTGSAYNILTVNHQQNHFADFIFQNNGATGTSNGVVVNIGAIFERCVFRNFRGSGAVINSGAILIECEATNVNTSNTTDRAGFSMTSGQSACFIRCISHDNPTSNTCGFILYGNNGGSSPIMYNCIADSNGRDGLRCDAATNSKYLIHACVFFNNGRDGIRFIDNRAYYYIENCVFVNNAGYGINQNSFEFGSPHLVNHCAFFNNTLGETNNIRSAFITNKITLTSDPFADAPNGDFRVVSTQLLGTGRGQFTQIDGYTASTVSYPDVGAVQSPSGTASAIFASSQHIGRRIFQRTVFRKTPVVMPVTYIRDTPLPIPRWTARVQVVVQRKPPLLLPVPLVTVQVPVPVSVYKQRTQWQHRKTTHYIPGGTVSVPVLTPFPIIVPRRTRYNVVQKSPPSVVETYRSIPLPLPVKRIPYRHTYPQKVPPRYVVNTPIEQTVVVQSVKVVR